MIAAKSMIALDVHLEAMPEVEDPDKDLKEILRIGFPITISVSPHDLGVEGGGIICQYSPGTLELVKEIVKRPGSVLGQQGYWHKCKHPHRFVDKWHENHCLWEWLRWVDERITKQEQGELMERGRDKLHEVFDVVPELYVPPNHLFNADTLEVAEQKGYKFFADRDCIGLGPYKHGGLIILPETKVAFVAKEIMLGTKDKPEVAYIHYDRIGRFRDAYTFVTAHIDSVESLVLGEVSKSDIWFNRALKNTRKIARDLVKFPGRLLGGED